MPRGVQVQVLLPAFLFLIMYKHHKRHVRAFHFFGLFVIPWVRRKFNYDCDKIRGTGKPYILVCNHNTDFDPVFLANAVDDFVYLVATEKITRMGILGALVRFFFDPIVHYKGKMGINTVKDMLGHLKEGHNVGVFPEGNRSFNGQTNDFVSTIGKLAKKSGATLITYRLNGAYFSMPRWGRGVRKGKIYGELVNVYEPDRLALMSEEEVNGAIKADIYEDAYKRQELVHQAYIGENKALGIESTLFRCPSCGKVGTLTSCGDSVSCGCGFSSVYDDYGYLNCNDGSVKTITGLDAENRDYIRSLYDASTDELLFSDETVLNVINSKHKIEQSSEIILKAYIDRFELGDQIIPLVKIQGLAINQRNLLIMHTENKHYEISGPMSFSALKYLYLYEKI